MIRAVTRRSTLVSCAAATSKAPARASKLPSALTAVPRDFIDGGEIIILAIKPSMWRPLFDSAAWVVTAFLLAGALTWMGTPLRGLTLAASAQVVLLVALGRVVLAVLQWIPTWYVLTNRRVIAVRGVRSPRISACLLVQVRNTYLRTSQAEKLARLGTITFVADHANRVTLRWQSIAGPAEVHAKIRRAIENALDQHDVTV